MSLLTKEGVGSTTEKQKPVRGEKTEETWRGQKREGPGNMEKEEGGREKIGLMTDQRAMRQALPKV